MSIDLNCRVENDHHIELLVLTQLHFLAAQSAIWAKVKAANLLSEDLEDFAFQKNLTKLHELIEIMKHHPDVDIASFEEEKRMLQDYFYFEDDPLFERDCQIFVDGLSSLEALEKHVKNGFNLYSPIGKFSILMEASADVSWIELFCFMGDYEEAELIDLMEKQRH